MEKKKTTTAIIHQAPICVTVDCPYCKQDTVLSHDDWKDLLKDEAYAYGHNHKGDEVEITCQNEDCNKTIVIDYSEMY